MMNNKILLREIKKPDEIDGIFVAKDEEQSMDCEVMEVCMLSQYEKGEIIFISKYNTLKACIDNEHYLITDEDQIWGVR